MFRMDRYQTSNRRVNGGGVLLLVRKFLSPIQIQLPIEKTYIELVVIQITLANKKYLVYSIYIPPYDKQLSLEELSYILQLHKIKYPNHNYILTGDFNLSNLKWHPSDDALDILSPSSITPCSITDDFVMALSQLNLHQINHMPNNQGKFLDLVFCNLPSKAKVNCVSSIDELDSPTHHHLPLAIDINFNNDSGNDGSARRAIKTLNYTKANRLLANSLHAFTTDIISETQINTFVSHLQKIIVKCTQTKLVKAKLRVQPWLIKNQAYAQQKHIVNKLHKATKNTIAQKNEYLKQKKQLITIYNQSKLDYYEKIINASSSEPKHLFTLIKTKHSIVDDVPTLMSLNGTAVSACQRDFEISKHLASNFRTSASNDYSLNLFSESQTLNDIYTENYDNSFCDLFSNYDLSISAVELRIILNSFSSKKDAGPMNIPLNFILQNLENTTIFTKHSKFNYSNIARSANS